MLRRGGDSSAVKYELLYPGPTGGVVVRGLSRRARAVRVALWEQRNSGVVREGLVDSAHREDTRRGLKGRLRVHDRVSSAEAMFTPSGSSLLY